MVRAGEVSATELVGLYLDRIQRLDPELNAFRVVLGERAMLEAEQAEARLRAGDERPLLGVPIAIKDEVDLAGELNTHGTDGFPEPAPADSEMVRRLREAGAIMIGKTLLPELAMFGFTESATYGVTRNPWDPQRTTGGSSGGSAAAVAAGLVPIAHASDGAGSIRIPASSCGLFGLKPQRGRISLDPFVEHWNGLSVNGCLSRSVGDTALWLDVTSGGSRRPARPRPPSAPSSIPRRPRPALCGSPSRPWRPGAAPADTFRGSARRGAEHGRGAAGPRAPGRRADPDWGRIGNNMVPRYLRGGAEDVDRAPAAAARAARARLRPTRRACTGGAFQAARRPRQPTRHGSTRSSMPTTC